MPAPHVTGQQSETFALASQHLYWDQLEDRIFITVCGSVILKLL